MDLRSFPEHLSLHYTTWGGFILFYFIQLLLLKPSNFARGGILNLIQSLQFNTALQYYIVIYNKITILYSKLYFNYMPYILIYNKITVLFSILLFHIEVICSWTSVKLWVVLFMFINICLIVSCFVYVSLVYLLRFHIALVLVNSLIFISVLY